MIDLRQNPYTGYRFLIQIESLIVAGFSQVTGLEVRMEPESYQEGGVNTHSHKLPTRYEHGNLELRRGLTDSQGLYRWIQDGVSGQIRRRDGIIFLLDSEGLPSWGWAFRNAYPVRWAGPELQAEQASVAIETLELAHDGLSKVPGLPAGVGWLEDVTEGLI